MISVPQLRAARALLGWSQDQLAAQSGVSKPTIARLELGSGTIGGYASTQEKLQAALESAGVIFVDENGEGPGVRLKKDRQTLDRGIEASEEALTTMDKKPSPRRALHEMKVAIGKDVQRGRRKGKPDS